MNRGATTVPPVDLVQIDDDKHVPVDPLGETGVDEDLVETVFLGDVTKPKQ